MCCEGGVPEMYMIIIIHALFPAPLDNGALDRALAGVLVLVPNNSIAKGLACLGKDVGVGDHARRGMGTNWGEFASYGFVRGSGEAFVKRVGEVNACGASGMGPALGSAPDGRGCEVHGTRVVPFVWAEGVAQASEAGRFVSDTAGFV